MKSWGHERIQPRVGLTNGVLPTAPTKPSTVPEVNDLPSCSLKTREFWVTEARTEANIVVVELQGWCELDDGEDREEPMH